MGVNDNNGQKGRQGFPTKEIPPLNIEKIPRQASPRPNPTKAEPDEKEDPKSKTIRRDKKLDEALKSTFPASDPVQQP